MLSPHQEYRTRREAREASHRQWSALDARLSYARLAVAGLGVVVVWVAIASEVLSGGWIGALVVALLAVFLALVVRHDRVVRARDAAERARQFYERGLARIEDRWTGLGSAGERFADEAHLYAADLDLFGEGSLFQLLSVARTASGERTLAEWLKAPASVPTIRDRQEAVGDLRDRLDFREALSLAGTTARRADTDTLDAWATVPTVLAARWPRVVAPLVVASLYASAIWAWLGGPLEPLGLIAIVQMGFAVAFRVTVVRVVHGVSGPLANLDFLAHALACLEAESFEAPRLNVLRDAVTEQEITASAAIRRLHRLSDMHDWQHNMIFGFIGATLLWSTQLAFAIEVWRGTFGSHVPRWIESLGEAEALSSLATYAYEHPDDPFPTVVETDGVVFAGASLGHPLVPAARMVRNTVRFDATTRLLVVSGSNMSGKSTLLRTVGVNVVLALAGAPVRAERLDLVPVSLGATLRIQDSLQEGRSRFFAEITRIRHIADLVAGPRVLLFLFDELLQGTNSHDRVAGSAAVLGHLVSAGGYGLITTHDLALTTIADRVPGAVNVHFADEFRDGQLTFDYTMKPGPVSRSNALALMRAVGLEGLSDPGAGT